MKKTIWIVGSIVLIAAVVVAVLLLTKPKAQSAQEEATPTLNMSIQGKHCNGTVGCDCPGFEPILDQQEWKKPYCKKCGHHKNNHR